MKPANPSNKPTIPVLTNIVKPGILEASDTAEKIPASLQNKSPEELEKIIAIAIREKMQFYVNSISADIAAEIMTEIKYYLEKNTRT